MIKGHMIKRTLCLLEKRPTELQPYYNVGLIENLVGKMECHFKFLSFFQTTAGQEEKDYL